MLKPVAALNGYTDSLDDVDAIARTYTMTEGTRSMISVMEYIITRLSSKRTDPSFESVALVQQPCRKKTVDLSPTTSFASGGLQPAVQARSS